MTEAAIEPFAPAHLDGLIALVGEEGWTGTQMTESGPTGR